MDFLNCMFVWLSVVAECVSWFVCLFVILLFSSLFAGRYSCLFFGVGLSLKYLLSSWFHERDPFSSSLFYLLIYLKCDFQVFRMVQNSKMPPLPPGRLTALPDPQLHISVVLPTRSLYRFAVSFSAFRAKPLYKNAKYGPSTIHSYQMFFNQTSYVDNWWRFWPLWLRQYFIRYLEC